MIVPVDIPVTATTSPSKELAKIIEGILINKNILIFTRYNY